MAATTRRQTRSMAKRRGAEPLLKGLEFSRPKRLSGPASSSSGAKKRSRPSADAVKNTPKPSPRKRKLSATAPAHDRAQKKIRPGVEPVKADTPLPSGKLRLRDFTSSANPEKEIKPAPKKLRRRPPPIRITAPSKRVAALRHYDDDDDDDDDDADGDYEYDSDFDIPAEQPAVNGVERQRPAPAAAAPAVPPAPPQPGAGIVPAAESFNRETVVAALQANGDPRAGPLAGWDLDEATDPLDGFRVWDSMFERARPARQRHGGDWARLRTGIPDPPNLP